MRLLAYVSLPILYFSSQFLLAVASTSPESSNSFPGGTIVNFARADASFAQGFGPGFGPGPQVTDTSTSTNTFAQGFGPGFGPGPQVTASFILSAGAVTTLTEPSAASQISSISTPLAILSSSSPSSSLPSSSAISSPTASFQSTISASVSILPSSTSSVTPTPSTISVTAGSAETTTNSTAQNQRTKALVAGLVVGFVALALVASLLAKRLITRRRRRRDLEAALDFTGEAREAYNTPATAVEAATSPESTAAGSSSHNPTRSNEPKPILNKAQYEKFAMLSEAHHQRGLDVGEDDPRPPPPRYSAGAGSAGVGNSASVPA
ncbi:hypothetical protein FB45DRAFT_939016 [Roridomyces roridus]|uniref:Mid2 domain-containing protein n=1 Tax=Roridomyces roridus TaxID=1738132 RepID=A0AAD7B8E8_9AGAR|nr:hypothetical protein FB45DRAFT_939016 [Roridomyces roridus]